MRFLLILVLLFGCNSAKQEKIPVVPLYKYADKEPTTDFWVSEIEYQGHKYVVIEGELGVGLTHKVNCTECEK